MNRNGHSEIRARSPLGMVQAEKKIEGCKHIRGSRWFEGQKKNEKLYQKKPSIINQEEEETLVIQKEI
jgi:hypothetical protein